MLPIHVLNKVIPSEMKKKKNLRVTPEIKDKDID
jgi:hypothetical protein